MKHPTRPARFMGVLVWRGLWTVVGAVVLLSIGTLLHSVGLFEALRQVALREGDPATRIAQAQSAARADWSHAWARYASDPNVPPPAVPVDANGYFLPAALADVPDDEFGKAVKRGYAIFSDTQTAATRFVGNSLVCSNCHLNAGRLAHAAPMWAAAVAYPAWRSKNDEINTLEERIRGCFTYSMNGGQSQAGRAPADGDHVLADLASYMAYLAEGAPMHADLPGRGFPVLKETDLGFSVERGATVYATNCALCHGSDGAGRKGPSGENVFPALWGSRSYNWGAGMHRINTAAGFIKANMPYGNPSLSDQDAWDVAAFMNSHERPPDPRQVADNLTVAEARAKFQDSKFSLYGTVVRGDLLGDGPRGKDGDATPSPRSPQP